MKIQEMVFMLVAVMFFFILVALFAFAILYSGAKAKATELAQQRTLATVTYLSDSPEFSCVETKPRCVDGDKLIALVNKKEYQNFWPFSSLKLLRFSGFNKSEKDWIKCTTANYPDCDIFIVYDKDKKENVVSSYVNFCKIEYDNGNYNKCEVARLLAGTEPKG